MKRLMAGLERVAQIKDNLVELAGRMLNEDIDDAHSDILNQFTESCSVELDMDKDMNLLRHICTGGHYKSQYVGTVSLC